MRRSRPISAKHADGVVDGASRDGADVSPDDLDQVLRREVRPARHRPQDGQALRRDLEALLAEQMRRVDRHGNTMCKFLSVVKWVASRPSSSPGG